jgi:hypothetical protein
LIHLRSSAMLASASVIAWLTASGSLAIDHTDAESMPGQLSALLAVDPNTAESNRPIAFSQDEADLLDAPNPESANGPSLASQEPESKSPVNVALADPLAVEPLDTATGQMADTGIRSAGAASQAVDTTEVLDECFIVETCFDRYLWALYQRTPKEDTVKEEERRKVSVRKRGKLITVMKTFTKHVDEEFSWKDRKAADRAGMSLMDYVVGGVDPAFRRRLFYLLHAAEEAGLSPGITSAFRDDYRQSIASGLKAATDRSYHGGSFRGGYGHGLAADVVSVKGSTRTQRLTSTETLWKWIDAHGQEFGIGRPYLDRDPPHLAPIDGKEYASHHSGTRARQDKARDRVVMRNHHRAANRSRAARSSRVRAT